MRNTGVFLIGLSLLLIEAGYSDDARLSYTRTVRFGFAPAKTSVERIDDRLRAEKIARLGRYFDAALEKQKYRLAEELIHEILRLDPQCRYALKKEKLLQAAQAATNPSDPPPRTATAPDRPNVEAALASSSSFVNRHTIRLFSFVTLLGVLLVVFAFAFGRGFFFEKPSVVIKKLKSLQKKRANGCLAIVARDKVGLIFLRDGKIVGAAVGDDSETAPGITVRKGVDAFRDIETWRKLSIYYVASLSPVSDNIPENRKLF